MRTLCALSIIIGLVVLAACDEVNAPATNSKPQATIQNYIYPTNADDARATAQAGQQNLNTMLTAEARKTNDVRTAVAVPTQTADAKTSIAQIVIWTDTAQRNAIAFNETVAAQKTSDARTQTAIPAQTSAAATQTAIPSQTSAAATQTAIPSQTSAAATQTAIPSQTAAAKTAVIDQINANQAIAQATHIFTMTQVAFSKTRTYLDTVEQNEQNRLNWERNIEFLFVIVKALAIIALIAGSLFLAGWAIKVGIDALRLHTSVVRDPQRGLVIVNQYTRRGKHVYNVVSPDRMDESVLTMREGDDGAWEISTAGGSEATTARSQTATLFLAAPNSKRADELLDRVLRPDTVQVVKEIPPTLAPPESLRELEAQWTKTNDDLDAKR